MNRVILRCVAVLVTLSPFIVASWVHAQQNGEARATVPTVVRTDYDMRAFIAPLSLNETELKGRKLFAQRCANCHGVPPKGLVHRWVNRPSRGEVSPSSARKLGRDR